MGGGHSIGRSQSRIGVVKTTAHNIASHRDPSASRAGGVYYSVRSVVCLHTLTHRVFITLRDTTKLIG